MDDKRYRLPGNPVFSIPAADAERLVALGDGDAALLYLHMLRTGGVLSVTEAARALGRSDAQIRDTAARLRRAGVLAEEEQRVLSPAEELPEYSAEDIVRRSREDSAFKALVAEAQRMLGHSLSGADLKTLFGIYDRLGLPTDVIMLILNHCADKARKRYGEGRLPTMRAIEKEAFYWANREIVTMEQAEEYLASLARREQEGERVRQALQIANRELTPTERKYLDDWLAMGYGAEALSIAYDRTMVSTGKLAWAYMNKIVLDWYGKGLFTPEEIEKGDGRGRTRKPAVPAGGGTSPGGDDLELLERMLNKGKR